MKRRIVLASLGLGLLLVVFTLIRVIERDAATPPSTPPATTKPSIVRDGPSSLAHRSGGDSEIERAKAGERNPVIIHKPGPDAIAKEFVLRFRNAEDMQRFLALARTRGVTVLGTLDKFHAVRIRVNDREDLVGLLEDGPTPLELGDNYWVRVPETANRDVRLPEGVYTAFGGEALKWLGIEGDRHLWGKGITVAILDTGIEDHATFAGKTITRLDLLGAEGTALGPYAGHGTAVASIVAGSLAEASGIAPGTDLLSIRVASGDGIGNGFTVASAIVEAVDRGADVISLSLGSQGDSFILAQAVDYALEHGVAIVASVGNDAFDSVSYPAKYDGVIAVSAIDANARHMFFANRGPEVDLAAPGLGVNTAWSSGQIVSFSGTSAAAPFVAGALATLLSSESNLSPLEAAEILAQTSADAGAAGHDDEYGSGILDLDRAMHRDERGIYDMALVGIFLDSASRTLSVTAQNRGTEKIPGVELRVSIDATSYSYHFADIGVGRAISQPFSADLAKLQQERGVIVRATVMVRGAEDGEPGNNTRIAVLSVPK